MLRDGHSFDDIWFDLNCNPDELKNNTRIVYMGTPEFAVPPLEALIEAGYTIPAVITVADKPAGRGRKLRESAVKVCAVKNGLKVLQPTNLKDEDFVTELRSLNADLFIVVAFRMLPEIVWSMPALGTFNLHGSLLQNIEVRRRYIGQSLTVTVPRDLLHFCWTRK